MKIMFFASDNNNTSGAFLCLVKLVVLLRDRHCVESVVILPYSGDGETLLKSNNIQYEIVKSTNWIIRKNGSIIKRAYRTLRMYKKVFSNAEAINKCKYLIKKYQPDFIHINTTFTYVGAVAAKQLNVPVIWHLREMIESGMDDKIWNRKYGYWLMDKSEKIVCVSNSVKQEYCNIFKDSKMCVIYDGLEVNNYTYIDQKSKDKISMICVGALGEHKGQEAIIRACKLLKDDIGSKFKLQIVGRGPSEANYRMLIDKLYLNDVVELSGVTDNISDYYNKAHFTIVNGKCEGFGRVTVEAMLCGSYVIGCDTGGTKELLADGKYGLVFRQNDVQDLYEKLKYAFSHIDILMSQRYRNRQYALENFTSEINADNVYKLYNSLL